MESVKYEVQKLRLVDSINLKSEEEYQNGLKITNEDWEMAELSTISPEGRYRNRHLEELQKELFIAEKNLMDRRVKVASFVIETLQDRI